MDPDHFQVPVAVTASIPSIDKEYGKPERTYADTNDAGVIFETVSLNRWKPWINGTLDSMAIVGANSTTFHFKG